jgi:hypothetical protein
MTNTFEIVTDPKTGQQVYESKEHRLQVYFKDLENIMTCKEAHSACKYLGEDWRLPSVEEFEIMHRELFLNKIGDFNGHFFSDSDGYSGVTPEYWTSRFDDERGFPPVFWSYNFDAGTWVIYGEKVELGVRPVRSIKPIDNYRTW